MDNGEGNLFCGILGKTRNNAVVRDFNTVYNGKDFSQDRYTRNDNKCKLKKYVILTTIILFVISTVILGRDLRIYNGRDFSQNSGTRNDTFSVISIVIVVRDLNIVHNLQGKDFSQDRYTRNDTEEIAHKIDLPHIIHVIGGNDNLC